MKNNQPVTQVEQRFKSKEDLVSITDLQGKIQYANQAFLEISGFTKEELIGQDHNIVRHPDMPPAAFADLWGTVKSGKAWRGRVKNRCKNGDHYWVDAFVTPVIKQGKAVGYQSVRSEPSREQVSQAEKLYAAMCTNRQQKLPPPSLRERTSIKSLNSIASLLLCGLLIASAALVDSSVGFTVILLTLICQIALWLFNHSQIFHPLTQIDQHNKDIASGDFTQPIVVKGSQEIVQMKQATKMVQARYKAIFMQVSDSLKIMTSVADDLSAASHDVLAQMKKQNSHTSQIATGMSEMSATVEDVTENVKATSETTNYLSEKVVESDQVVADALATMQDFSQQMTQTTEHINKLSQESKQISSITDTISSIAEQTNLLALNAAIEAARAGEQGRGFAVVADEVRSLAGRTQEATQEIRQMLEHLSNEISDSASTIEQNNSSAHIALEKVSTSREKFRDITEGVERINQMSSEIATAVGQQAIVANEMAASIETISHQSAATEREGEKLQDSAMAINQSTSELQSRLNDLELSEAQMLDFATAKQAHLAWKTRVRSYLNGDHEAITRQQACSHHDCALGQWYYSDGQKQFGHFSEFKSIEQPHAELHRTIKSVLDAVEQNDHDKAEALYEKLEPLSKQIVGHLDRLELSAKNMIKH